MNLKDEIEYIADHYGIHSQLIKLMEEMSEVTKEITKLLNATDDETIIDIYRNTLPEELADLRLVYDQVVYLLGCKEKVEAMRNYKVMRQIRRIRLEDN